MYPENVGMHACHTLITQVSHQAFQKSTIFLLLLYYLQADVSQPSADL